MFISDLMPASQPQIVEVGKDKGDLGPPGRWQLKVSWEEMEKILPPRPGMQLLDLVDAPEAWIKEDQAEFCLWRRGFSLSLNLSRGEGEAQFFSPREWQSVLRVIYFHGFLQHQGLLFHSAGLVRQGLAYLFPGSSGAGKTTIVRHSPGMAILSDEISAVWVPGNGSPVSAFGTPIYGEWGKPGENISAQLKGLYFPIHCQRNYVIPLTPGEVCNLLLRSVCICTTWRPRLDKLFTLVAQLAERVPGYALHFRPGPDFWKAIDGY